MRRPPPRARRGGGRRTSGVVPLTSTAERLAAELLARLAGHGDPARAEGERRYLKSEREFLGVPVPVGRSVVKGLVREHPDLDHDLLVATALAAWGGPYFECRRAAAELLAARVDLLGIDDLALIESLVRDGETWAIVDLLSTAVAGPLVVRFAGDPVLGRTLDRWARDPDSFWVRRASMLALLPSLRTSLDQWPRCCQYAGEMLHEREFFIRKAIGWVLRDASRRWPDEVRAWVEPRLHLMSGVTRREATKYLLT